MHFRAFKNKTTLQDKQCGYFIIFVSAGVELDQKIMIILYDPLIRVESRTQGSKPRTALPRTDPLKAKDQGHNVEVTSKKRSLLLNNQNFPAISSGFQEKTVFKNSLISAYTLLYYAY